MCEQCDKKREKVDNFNEAMNLKIIKKDEPIGLDIDDQGNIEFRELVYEIYVEKGGEE